MTPVLWALEGVAAVGLGLIVYALWPERQPRAERGPARVAQHAAWTMGGETVRLHEQWPTAAAVVRVGARCECPAVIDHGRILVPLEHYAGCPRAVKAA